MMANPVVYIVQMEQRADTEANLIQGNPVLGKYELCFTDNGDGSPIRMKIGDGTSHWKDIAYFGGLKGDTGISITNTSLDSNNNLIITYSDGSQGKVGPIPTVQGKKGDPGNAGAAATIQIGTVTTGAPGTQASVANVGTADAAILNITIPQGTPGAGNGDMTKAAYDKDGDGIADEAAKLAVPRMLAFSGDFTGGTTFDGSANISIAATLASSGVTAGSYNGMTINAKGLITAATALIDTDAYNIPAGATFAQKRVGRNRSYSYLWVDCRKADGITAENPTSLTITIYQNGTLIYTSPAITTASFTATLNLSINAGDLIAVVASNTTGLTGALTATLGMGDR